MLARQAWFIISIFMTYMGSSLAVHSENQQPDITIIWIDGSAAANNSATAVDSEKLAAHLPQIYSGDIYFSPGASASLCALLTGNESLIHGVISDADWRRRPALVTHPLASSLNAYHSQFYGIWTFGKCAPFSPADFGFASASYQPDENPNSIANWWHESQLDDASKREAETSSLLNISNQWSEPSSISAANFMANASRLIDKHPANRSPLFTLIKPMIADSTRQRSAGLRKQNTSQLENATVQLANTLAKRQSQRAQILIVAQVNPTAQLVHRGFTKTLTYFPGKLTIFGQTEYAQPFPKQDNLTDHQLYAYLLKISQSSTQASAVQWDRSLAYSHLANWREDAQVEQERFRGSVVSNKQLALINGIDLYPADQPESWFGEKSSPLAMTDHPAEFQYLITQQSAWWAAARQAIHNPRPFTVGADNEKTTTLTADQWSESVFKDGQKNSPEHQGLQTQQQLVELLRSIQLERHRRHIPSTSGGWSIDVKQAGNYELTTYLLPQSLSGHADFQRLAGLRAGQMTVQIGSRRMNLIIHEGASRITSQMDLDPGIFHLECVFTHQLGADKLLGAPFIEIKRLGEKKVDITPEMLKQ